MKISKLHIERVNNLISNLEKTILLNVFILCVRLIAYLISLLNSWILDEQMVYAYHVSAASLLIELLLLAYIFNFCHPKVAGIPN